MPRKRNGEIPLPEGWDFAQDYDGKVYFIDHNTKKTTWIDPRDRFTKPQSFADCIGNELPLGWEEAFDPHIGVYYINHVSQCTQLEDPRLEWRAIQEAMLREYLTTAQDVLEAKKEIYDVKQQRLYLAQDEYNHLNNALLNNSRSSLCSSSSSASTKYDVDLLKSDVALARDRVSRLKRELEQIRTEMNYTQRGVETLASVEQKLGSTGNDLTGGCYNITEVQAIMVELREIQKSLTSGEKERSELMQSLAKLKDELTRLELCADSSPDVSTLNLQSPALTLSTASQTDLCAELVPMGTRLAEMARMRLEYDETRKRIQLIQTQLADLEEKVTPGQAESDKDRLILFQEKEQLLRELRSIISSSSRSRRSHEEMTDIQTDIRKLEQDLKDALEMSNRAIADRLRLHEEKQLLLSQLRDALRSMTLLESQLRSLSASTLSVSSSSSLGSLSTTSSKGSLSSGLSFTDIYVPSSCITMSESATSSATTSVNMADLHRRVERLLKGEPPLPPPPYESHSVNNSASSPSTTLITASHTLGDLLYKGTNMSQGSGLGRPSSPLSPISETPPLAGGGPPSPPSTRSVSAAVSDESVAGDSGVFEASNVKRHLSDSSQCETAQVQIKLRYCSSDATLHISIEKARGLSALLSPTDQAQQDCQVYIKAALLPSGPCSAFSCTTRPVSAAAPKPRFGESFSFPGLALSKLCSKTLQVNVWSVTTVFGGVGEKRVDCVGCAQVSLADFTSMESVSTKWYNILSLKCFQSEDESPPPPPLPPLPAHITTVKEESSDESTIISSQTSTLTRNQGCEGVPCEAVSLKLEQLNREFLQSSSSDPTDPTRCDEYEEDEEEEEEFDEEEEDYMEEDEEGEGEGDASNAQNIFAVKEITDLIFSGGNFKEGDELKDSIDFSETCVQQMFGKDILAEDNSSSSPGEHRSVTNGHQDSPSGEGGDSNSNPRSPAVSQPPSTPGTGGAKRGRPRKKSHGVNPTAKKRGRKRKKDEGVDVENEFPAEYLLSIGLDEKNVEELKLGFTVLQDIMCQPCSAVFIYEPDLSEVGDKIEYDQIIDRPMWLTLVEQNLCKGVIKTLGDLMCDIRLIVENCYKFWKHRDDSILRTAFKLERCLLERLVLLPEEAQSRVSWDVNNLEMINADNDRIKSFSVQDIRTHSKLFRLVESTACKSSEQSKITKEALEADIIDFENNVVFSDGNTIIETVNCMWELADIGHFLCLTHSLLRVPQPTQLEVERMFLLPQSSSTLARLFTSLLVRPVSRVRLERGPPMPYEVWKARLSVKVSEWYRIYHAKGRDEIEVFESIGLDPMFWNILGPDYNPLESHDYHELHYFQRVWLFKGLCSYVLHNHKSMADLFNSLAPEKARIPPLGNDRQGNAYYFYPDFIDVRLYKQNLPRLTTSKASLQTNPKTPVNSVHIPPEERELFFPKQKFLPYRRKDNMVILANSVEGLEILLGEFKEERLDEGLIQGIEELHGDLKRRETYIEYMSYRARCAMFNEYAEYVKRPDNYEDPDLKYWTFKMTREDNSAHTDDNHNEDNEGEASHDAQDGDGAIRRSRRELHPIHKTLSGPTLSDLDLTDSSEDASDAGSAEFGSEEEWDPSEGKKGKKKTNLFGKPPVQGADDMIKPASPEREEDGLDNLTLQPPTLRTPGSSPTKPMEGVSMEDPLNIFSMKRELVEEAQKDRLDQADPPPASSSSPRPLIKVKSNLVREDFTDAASMLTLAPPPLLLPPQPPPMPPLDQDPLATPLPSNVKKEEKEDDDDIEVLSEKVLRPPHPQGGAPMGENSIMKIGNMVYRLTGPPPGMQFPPGALGRPLAPGAPLIRSRLAFDPSQQLVIQNPRTLNPRMRGRPSMTGMMRGGRNPGPGGVNAPRGVVSMRGSPRQMSPRGGMNMRGGLNITPRKATPPPIPRQLLNRNISVSIVEPKPKPALPKLAGVTITPTKNKPSPAKTLIFNSSPTSSLNSMTKSPSVKTQMVDANVQLQWQSDGTTSYVIELANNQTQALTKEQVQFFKNKHNGTMPNVVRIAVPEHIARRVKPPCITL
uniref:Protein kibra n=1 Tax=Cacopsylla melanoneura TaxID=428564 RepID=A0A8D8UYC3_9HEMI